MRASGELISPSSIVRPTTFIESPRLSRILKSNVVLASETFQHTGSFKFRAAFNVVSKVAHPQIITASSGNFGQAIAYACQLIGKSCTIVMPTTSARVKIEAVRDYGGTVDLIDTKIKSRSDRVRELAEGNPHSYVASAYDDPLVIEGNASLGAEIAAFARDFDYLIAPVGGGGLISGLVLGLQKANRKCEVIGVEPSIANDAAISLKTRTLVRNDSEPQTIADGVRTLSLGKHNWEIIRENVSRIVEVSEDQITEALCLLFITANLKVEPTGALALAALLSQPELFKDKSLCCVVSGGNVDPELFARLISR